jgi:uncharacterized tellurite resistance protein B-like protein
MPLRDALRGLMASLHLGDGAARWNPADARVAATALMLHVMALDGTVTDSEQAALEAALARTWNLDRADIDDLISAAAQAERETLDIADLTATLRRKLDGPQRLGLLGVMRDLVVADGGVHEFEETTLLRIAELLDLSEDDLRTLGRPSR